MKKNRIQALVADQPDDVDVDALMEQLHLLEKIERAEAELSAEKGIPHESVVSELQSWLRLTGQLC